MNIIITKDPTKTVSIEFNMFGYTNRIGLVLYKKDSLLKLTKRAKSKHKIFQIRILWFAFANIPSDSYLVRKI
jgi:hypothetical protein